MIVESVIGLKSSLKKAPFLSSQSQFQFQL